MPLPRIGNAQPAAEPYSLPQGVKLLTATDRCDGPACGSQARAVIQLESGAELLFCRHHTEVYRKDLEEKKASIYTQYKGL